MAFDDGLNLSMLWPDGSYSWLLGTGMTVPTCRLEPSVLLGSVVSRVLARQATCWAVVLMCPSLLLLALTYSVLLGVLYRSWMPPVVMQGCLGPLLAIRAKWVLDGLVWMRLCDLLLT